MTIGTYLVVALAVACEAPRTMVATWAPEPSPHADRSGRVESVTEITSPHSPFAGVGIVLGAVLGAMLARDDAMLFGAMVGGATGLAVGPSPGGGERSWRVQVRVDDGTTALFECRELPPFRAGDVVAIRDGALARGACAVSSGAAR